MGCGPAAAVHDRGMWPGLRPYYWWIILVALMASNLPGQPAATAAQGAEDGRILRGILETVLPFAPDKDSLELTFSPRFGDLIRRDHMRLPTGLRYGLSRDWEVSGEAEVYFAHGLGDVKFFEKTGVAGLNLGTKYRLRERFWRGWDTGLGLEHFEPIGRPPPDVSDGRRHLHYYATFSRQLEGPRDLRVFWSLGTHHRSSPTGPVSVETRELGNHWAALGGGFIWKRGVRHYTFEAIVESTRGIGTDENDVLTLRPGIVWLLSPQETADTRKRVAVGFTPRIRFGPEGITTGANVRVYATFDFKRWWRNTTRGKPAQ